MGIEDGGLDEVIVEGAEDEADDMGACPRCHELAWIRMIAVYARGSCWVICCGNCGDIIEKRWNVLPQDR